MKKKKIVNVPYGIASSYDDFIEINSKIKGSLRRKILDHEKRHTVGRYTYKDFKNDFISENPYFLESLKFAIKNPESFINFCPLMYSYYAKRWSYNTTAFFPIIYFGVIYVMFWRFTLHINPLLSVINWLIIVIIINGFLILATEFHIRNVKRI